ncbi:S-layer homology domain-containing protein [Paenibacillus sp. 19GGS1-52]|uniref:S-layer homology domain-containing protein n=1 Tax=Paenibacillus sp. 19GGS1-52 TaxID=2758563 RepID=UPI001EFA7000|nr:6-bladed beta-propeller [Paenibacillus sp. 19GGS1-52]ULO06830.1 S-layer homology domain-containing protein [Paenibacillus sp. 19GGS1-52]
MSKGLRQQLSWFMVVVLLLGTLSVQFSAKAYASPTSSGIHELPTSGKFKLSGEGEFYGPAGAAVDSYGNIYVIDRNNNRIQKFDSNGVYLMQWGEEGTGKGQFYYPESITIDDSGNVYVMEMQHSRIQKFDQNGVYLSEWGSAGSGDGEFNYPQGITVDSSGNVYVLDTYNYRVQKFDTSGAYLTQWGSAGSGNGEFSLSYGITADDNGNVYVADSNNNRIQKFDSNGAYLMQWGNYGGGEGEFNISGRITVDSSGNVYVFDSDHRVQKFDSNGVFLTQWGSEGSGESEFSYSFGITVDDNGNVYVVDSDNSRIQKFDSNGNYLTQWGSYSSTSYFSNVNVALSNGDIYVTDTNHNRILKFDANGNLIMKWGRYGSGDGEFDNPYGIAVDDAGNVYVADGSNNRIQKFNSNGEYLAQWGRYGSGDGEFNYPFGITIDDSGNLYVAESNNNRIQKFNLKGDYLTKWGSQGSGNGQFYTPLHITIDHSGIVYVLDHDNNRVQKFDSNGNYLLQWGSYGNDKGQFRFPRGIAVDEGGNVYVVDGVNNRIQKFDAEGTYLSEWNNDNSGDTEFVGAITFDSSGKLYMQDASNVRIFSPNDNTHVTDLTLSAGTLSPSVTADNTVPYTATVAADMADLTITTKLADPLATVEVTAANGAAAGSVLGNVTTHTVPLQTGVNVITVKVTAMDGTTTKAYRLHVTRLSNNALLSNLAVSQGALSPTFLSGKVNYTVAVANAVSDVELSFSKGDPTQTISVTGAVYSTVTNDVYTYNASLNVGVNPVQVTVLAEDGTSNRYTVNVTRAAAPVLSGNADLGELTLSSGTLSPDFSAETTGYTSTVANGVSSLAVTASVYDSNAALKVNGISVTSSQASGAIPLSVGSNSISVAVTAQDGTVKTYTVMVTRAAAEQPTATPPPTLITTTDGKLTLPVGIAGKVSLNDEITLSIPSNATNQVLRVTIAKVLDTLDLLTNQQVLVSPVFELLKNFTENFINPVILTFTFDPVKVNSSQRAAVFYYDELQKIWVEVAGGTVNGNHITVSVDHFNKYYAVFAVDLAAPTTVETQFSDIAGHWAEASIKQAVADGIVKGYLDGTFKPGNSVTRAEFAVMLMNTLQSEEVGADLGFTDRAKIGTWAKQAVAQAIGAGIIHGYEDGTFRPNAPITRAEMASMIASALKLTLETNAVTNFADDLNIPTWAKGAVAAVKKLGLIEGKGLNQFDPAGNTTRAEAITVLLKMLAQQSK